MQIMGKLLIVFFSDVSISILFNAFSHLIDLAFFYRISMVVVSLNPNFLFFQLANY